MYGNVRSIKLPIFGSKVTAVRNGTIEMHGKNVGVTWTKLSVTANIGATSITVYLEPSILGLKPFVECWIRKLPETVFAYRDQLKKLFETFLEVIIYFLNLKILQKFKTFFLLS